jgi:hypothetical protein
VTERRERELDVEPIDQRVTHLVKAHEVTGTWRKSRPQNRPAVAAVRSTA